MGPLARVLIWCWQRFEAFCGWWTEAFGISDTLDRPDASSLAARAAGHGMVGAACVAIVDAWWGVPAIPTLAALAVLYGMWEFNQWRVDPQQWQRRVARRWDMGVDWTAVQLGGAMTAAAIAQLGALAGALAALLLALVLISAAIMGRASK
jgi:hypothetical protein